jgi:signal transduction histidine kinase
MVRTLGLPRRVAAGFAAAVLCLVVMVVFTTWVEAQRDQQARLVHRTQEALLAMYQVGGHFQIAATSLVAILQGSGWERDLATRAVGQLEPAVERLAELVGEDGPQRGRLDRLRPLARRLAARARAALMAMARGASARADELLEGVGPGALAEAEGIVGELERHEEAKLSRQQTRWRAVAAAGGMAFAAAALLLLVLVLQAARLVRNEMRERERLSAQRAEVVALQQQVMAIVSHDLRNPLAAMKGTAALLARSEKLDDEHREDARRIVSNARRMERLLRDLLDFSRLRAGKGLPVQLDRTDLVEVCRRAVSDLGREAEGRVAVEGRGDVSGRWDASRLEQVAANLVSNALKYGPADRPIRILVDGTGDEVRLAVADEGGGLPPGQHGLIFEPFRRGQDQDPLAARSAGLGLYIVRRSAAAHGGGFEVDSAPARGTTFTVRLPRGTGPAAAPPAEGG